MDCRLQVQAIARRLSEATSPINGAIVPLIGDHFLFFAAFFAGILSGCPCLLLTDRAEKTLSGVRAQFRTLRLITDQERAGAGSTPGFRADEVIRLTDFKVTGSGWEYGSVAPATTVAVAYTSGSTGKPRAFPKTLGGLVEEATAIGHTLRLTDSGRHLISTVPLHHMYGLAFGLIGPLCWSMSIDSERPVYPLDLARVLAAAPGPSWVVTTPTHLRAYVASELPLDRLAGFVCSTAPLPLDLARSAEARFACPVIEIYGSSETGAVARRRPCESDIWSTLETVRIEHDEGLRIHAPWLPEAGQLLDDRVEVIDGTSFRLLGRSADLVKIAGKRASLSDLSERLRAIEGVDDAVVFVPPAGPGGEVATPRLAAFVVGSDLDPREVTEALRAEMDPVFLPRPLIPAARLPRGPNGKLPRASIEALWREHTDELGRVRR